MKRFAAAFLAMAISFSASGCGCSNSPGNSSLSPSGAGTANQKKGEIYYLNFKPEVAEVYDEIAKAYEQETGVRLRVVTAASGTYEQTLKSEIAKSDAPTIFQLNGPRGYANWKDYCKDLSDTELYRHLTDPSLAITDGEGVYGIPYVVEGYGIIYNNAIMERYFALDDAEVDSMDEIDDFETLREVVEDMTAKKEELGIKGVFAATSLKPGEDWRWQTHLANVPIHYEFESKGIELTGEDISTVEFLYADAFRNIFDLYLNNSTTDPKLLGSKQVADSMAEFALGQCAMVQNGNWAYQQIRDVSGNTVSPEDIRFLPIYTGIQGEEQQGLCIGTEGYFAINAQSSPEQQKLAEDFLYWLFSSETGKDFVVNRLDFIAPFDTFGEDEVPNDPLAQEIGRWMNREEITLIPWDFTVFPSQTFKEQFGAALLQYAQGTKSWEETRQLFIDQWKAEAA